MKNLECEDSEEEDDKSSDASSHDHRLSIVERAHLETKDDKNDHLLVQGQTIPREILSAIVNTASRMKLMGNVLKIGRK